MPCLIIDTSTDVCLIALSVNDKIVDQEVFKHSNLLSKNLMTTVDTLMQKNGVNPSDLTSVAAGIGPGSYTGTRLGASVAKSLAFGLNIPIQAFHSPLAFIPDEQGAFAFIIPSRSGEYFLLKGDINANIARQRSARLVPPDTLAAATSDADFLIYSPPEKLPPFLKGKPCFEPIPNLTSLCRFLSSIMGSDPENIELQYLHTPF